MKKKRIVTVDMARMFAIFCVILTHSVEGVWQMDVNSLNARKDSINLVILGLHTIGRMGVPVFMLLSGYLLLDREYDKDKINKIYFREFDNSLLLPLNSDRVANIYRNMDNYILYIFLLVI